MSKKLNKRIRDSQEGGRTGLSVFVTAGYPTLESTVPILRALADSGVDFIELGIPFSDPIADGPVIQQASAVALRNGTTVSGILQIVRKFRTFSEMPILLMGYANPVFRMGMDTFLHQASEAGADGIILPDLPIEESAPFLPLARKLDLDFIHLIAPNTPMERIQQIDALTTSFLYCVAYTGVTGQNRELTPEARHFFTSMRAAISHPIFIGFGIRSHTDINRYAPFCDGVIVGTAFIQTLQERKDSSWEEVVGGFVRRLKVGE